MQSIAGQDLQWKGTLIRWMPMYWGGITALLGWENSALGDPRWDVARVENELLEVGDEQAVHQFRTVYQDSGGRPLADEGFWQALTAIQSWTMASWTNQT